jgi:3-oxoacyl-[acyl-carrier protein] reductase
MAEAGADVMVGYREREAEADEVVAAIERLGRRARATRADVSEPAEVSRLVGETIGAFGAVDVLVCNAGIARPRPADAIDLAAWDEHMAVNLRSAFLLTSAALPGMRARRWGRLLYLSSTAAQIGGIIGPHYAASKAGLLGLMHAYAASLAAEGITANAVSPGLIDTEMLPTSTRSRPQAVPVGRLGRPEEVARGGCHACMQRLHHGPDRPRERRFLLELAA